MYKANEKNAGIILKRLIKTYPKAKIELIYNEKDIWQLLVVVVLSAQTTDKKVNEISGALFDKFKTVYDFAKAKPKDIENMIKSIGLYKNKAKNVINAAKKIIEDFNGQVPKTREELENLPGIGRKSSGVIVANAFNTPALPVDTHVLRVSFRLGLTKNKDPNKVEEDLTKLFPKNKLIKAHHALVWHGRRICKAKKPFCEICPLEDICPKNGVLKNII